MTLLRCCNVLIIWPNLNAEIFQFSHSWKQTSRHFSKFGCHAYLSSSCRKILLIMSCKPSLHCRGLFYITLFVHSFISIQPYRPGWQEPEPSHVTGMAVAHCILGKFLGVVCHCFPPPLDVPTFANRCLYVRNDARDPSSERWNCGRESSLR